MHRGQGRSYIAVESYIRASRPIMDAMNIKTVLLFTDSQAAIDEATRCLISDVNNYNRYAELYI